MHRRAAPPLLALALGAAVLVGCSSDGGSDASPAPIEASTTTTAAATATTLPALDDQAAPPTINGLTVDGDALWIASIAGDEVLQVRRSDGAIVARYPTDGAGPDDVAVAPDGSVWSTGFVNGDLGRIADGRYEVVKTYQPGINPITVAPDGTVWIGTYGPDGSLYRLDPDQVDQTGRAPVTNGSMPDINAFGLLPDGRLFAPAGGIAGPGSAITFDPATGGQVTVAEGLPGVAAATVDSEGGAFVLANATGELYAVDPDARTSELVRTVSEGAPFDNLAFADDGTLYLSSFLTPTVTEVAPDGTTRVIEVGTAG